MAVDAVAVTRVLATPRTASRAASDRRLADRVRAGDDAAFETVYDRYHHGLLVFCAHMLGSRDDAEDAVQHVFASAYWSLRKGTTPIDFKPWLYAIARNRCVTVIRSRRLQLGPDDSGYRVPPSDGLPAEVERRADLREVVDDLQRLP